MDKWALASRRTCSDTEKYGELSTMASDMVADIVTGRKPLSGWRDFTEKWMDKGGAAMKAEYEASIAGG
ncbi:hypothetical protein OHA77_20000 [Streptosporangium sp. NBC_01639]|uniref:hypothetical protein n=1 Tax=Streptosporangium sp. NBC_01639 TaxID=2975948 RepID=UPI003870681C|nr:hypothetical protein OHA77_20000 [Streptosporangium sp. NBC_01639]